MFNKDVVPFRMLSDPEPLNAVLVDGVYHVVSFRQACRMEAARLKKAIAADLDEIFGGPQIGHHHLVEARDTVAMRLKAYLGNRFQVGVGVNQSVAAMIPYVVIIDGFSGAQMTLGVFLSDISHGLVDVQLAE